MRTMHKVKKLEATDRLGAVSIGADQKYRGLRWREWLISFLAVPRRAKGNLVSRTSLRGRGRSWFEFREWLHGQQNPRFFWPRGLDTKIAVTIVSTTSSPNASRECDWKRNKRPFLCSSKLILQKCEETIFCILVWLCSFHLIHMITFPSRAHMCAVEQDRFFSFVCRNTLEKFSKFRFVDHGSADLRFTNQAIECTEIILTIARAELNQRNWLLYVTVNQSRCWRSP